MSPRVVLSIITFVLIAVVLFFSRHELVEAWRLLNHVNVWILLLIVPVQLFVYYAAGETIFSYLRRKTQMKRVSPAKLMQLSLEMNFVNHALPSGGVSGVSYMTWRLKHFGIKAGRAASSQIVRVALTIAAMILLIIISAVIVTFDEGVNRLVILISSSVASVMLLGIMGLIILVSSRKRMSRFACWFTHQVNHIVRKLTRGRKRVVMHEEKLLRFFNEMHDDYLELRRDYSLLRVPFMWALAFVFFDAMLFVITFYALGIQVNPAPIIIAYCLASVAGFIVATPGGAGAYEAIMIAFLAVAGITSGSAIAAILLTRMIVLAIIVVLGYAFYQHSLVKYGKGKPPVQR